MIDKDSMQCYFVITAPDGDSFPLSRKCFADEFTSSSVEWYRDFLQDTSNNLEDDRGTSIYETRKMITTRAEDNVYGEYTIELIRVDYDMCVGEGEEIEEVDDA